ncbi:hypothetical protein OEZ86_004673 [Tetradesmus obliquus]|nr:hypothetical protein OEZ86_004673 [Tetradesmus obliquus]
MDGTTFRDVMQVVPALALAAAGQVAATALGQCARLFDEHGSTATLLARHAARSAAFYTDDLSVHVAESAHVAATHAAYSAQRQAERFSTITDALAAAVEASVQTAAASAQRCAHRQAGRAAAFADGQAAAANQALQSLAGVLPGFVPPPAEGFGSSSSSSSRAGDIFRAVERRAAQEQLHQLQQELQESRCELHAARLQLQAATDSVAALPQEVLLAVQGQMRRALREGVVELMREALASPEPGSPAAAAAAGVPVAGMYEQQQSEEEQQSDDGSEGRRSSSDGEAFVMVEAELAADGSN